MKADVLALVQLISNQQADPAVIDHIYDEVVNAWGARPLITNATLQTLVAGQTEFDFPAATILSVLGLIFDQRELGKLRLRELENLNPMWRSETGYPVAFTDEAEAAKSLALYPTPNVPSGPDLGNFGEPLGRDYPVYNLCLIHTEYRADVMPYLEPALTFYVLAREYARESDHVNPAMAALCEEFAGLCLEMIL